jgi:hypothetical protein
MRTGTAAETMRRMRRPRLALAAVLALVLLAALPAAANAAFGDRPTVNSLAATDVTLTSAGLKANVTFNQKAGEWWFLYCKVGQCDDPDLVTETPRTTEDIPTDEAAVTPRDLQWGISNLDPSTDYQVTLVAQSDSYNEANPNVNNRATRSTFTLHTADPVIPPTPVATSVQSQAATGVTATTATLNGTVVPGTTGAQTDRTNVFFEWGDQGGAFDKATPVQALPADATPRSVSAPLSDLTSGRSFQFRLVAVRNGQRFVTPARTFQTPTVPVCPAGTTFQTVKFEAITAVGCLKAAGNRYVALGAVQINGVLFEPNGGRGGNPHQLGCGDNACNPLQSLLNANNALYLDRGNKKFGTTGSWKMSAGPLVGMHKGVFDESNVVWDGSTPLLSAGTDASVELIDFPLAGQLTWTPKADGTSRLGLLVGMPFALGGVTGETAVKVNPGGDLSFDRIRIEVGEVPIKGFKLGGLKFLYDRTDDTWDGAANVTIPSPSELTIGVHVVVQNGQFSLFEGSVDNLAVELAPGIFLQKVGVKFGLNPVALGGTIGMSAGPAILGVTPIGVEGTFDLLPLGETVKGVVYPPSLKLIGTVTTFGQKLRQGEVKFYFTNEAWIEAKGEIGLNITSGRTTLFQLGGNVAGSLHGSDFEMRGDVGLTVFDQDIGKVRGLINRQGAAGCFNTIGWAGFGGYYKWGGTPALMWTCSYEDLKTALNSRAIRARASADGVVPLTLPASTNQVVRFVGQGGAPQVRLHGPGGLTIDTPGPDGSSSSRDSSSIAIRQDVASRTDVAIRATGDGKWSYELLPGSVPVARVERAGPLPAVNVKAKVTPARGGAEELTWSLTPIPGQKVTFSEQGPGSPQRVLKTTSAARGTVRFKPYLTLQRKRTIVALVEQSGKPRAEKVVATYTAPALGKVTGVRNLTATRSTKGVVTSTWAAMPAAQTFQVVVTQTSGRKTLKVVKRPKLVLSGAVGRTAKTVSVRAVSFDTTVGPSRGATVKPAKRKKK